MAWYSDSAASRIAASSTPSDSARSRSTPSGNFAYSSSSRGSLPTTSTGSGKSQNSGLYGSTASALDSSKSYSGPKGTTALSTRAYMAGGMSPLQSGITSSAHALGVSPQNLWTIISYETGGTMNPLQAGPTTKYGQHRGLIQFGEPQAKQYGVDWSNPLQSQLGPKGAVVQYLKDTGVTPGTDLLHMYAAVNAGNVNNINASDAKNGGAWGTVADKVKYQMAGHEKNASRLLNAPSNSFVNVASVPPIPPPIQRTPSTSQVARVPQSYGTGAYQTGPQSFSSPSAPRSYGYGVAQTGPQSSAVTPPAVAQAYGYGNYQTGPQAPSTMLKAPDTQVATNPNLYPKPLTNPVPPMGKLAAIGTDVMLGPGAHTLVNELRNAPQSPSPIPTPDNGNSQNRDATQSQVASASSKRSWQDILAEMNKGITDPTQQLANTLKVLSNPSIMYG